MAFMVRVRDCRMTLQQLSPRHLYPAPGLEVERGPIVVSRLDDGQLYVHNGRHRVLRARLAGVEWLEAVSLYDDDDTTPPAALFPAPRQVSA